MKLILIKFVGLLQSRREVDTFMISHKERMQYQAERAKIESYQYLSAFVG